jgi:CxxC-x17-CxxC domain-containing protein
MQDKTLTCRDCGREFTFTASEQEFFAQKGFTNEPGRCPECRAANKIRRGGYESRGGYERVQREMFPAVCAECGKDTQVPFQPRTDKPVYCSDCFATKRPAGNYERSSSSRGSYGGGNRW